jgi:hypothetical protein
MIPLNSDLGIFLFRAEHQHFPTPNKQQQQAFLNNVAEFQKQKLSRDESINLAFSITHWQ